MKARRAATMVALTALAVLALPQAVATAPPPAPPDPTCSPGPSACFSWHTTNVTVTWSAAPAGVTATGCGAATISSDTSGTAVSCTWSNAEGSKTTTANVRRDATPPSVSASPSRGPDANGWYNHGVTVGFSGSDATSGIASCSTVGYSGPDTAGTHVGGNCTDRAGNSAGASVEIKYDATPPSTTASPSRAPDANGWYNHALAVGFSGSDATSGIASCTSANYSGPDTGDASVSGSCSDRAGNSASASVAVKYDATAPSVEVKPERKPDANGWYNHAVTVAFLGSDKVSGVDSCAAPIKYKGPDKRKASLSGTCRDKAANTSPPAGFELRYDTKPPRLKGVKAEILSRGIVLRWTASKDTLSYAVVRRPGVRGRKPSTLYEGKARAFTDRRLRNGVNYRYTVTAYDQAGNAAVKVLLAQPRSLTNPVRTRPVIKPEQTNPEQTRPVRTRPALTKPAQGARVSVPPLLAWTAVPKATYYNVQLYFEGRKILTVWPRRASFRLQRSWKYGGLIRKLSPGRYEWYVWPGFGPPSANRYGKLLGKRSFVVVR